jgi:SCP-2 sterol transfer family
MCFRKPALRSRHLSAEDDVAKYLFLSDEWFVVVDELAAEHGAGAPSSADLLMNVTVTETPFGTELQLHLGAQGGQARWGVGHLDGADLMITTDYPTAREVFVSGDPTTGMQAFMSGRVKVQGDLAKLLAAQAAPAPDGASTLQRAIQDVTE